MILSALVFLPLVFALFVTLWPNERTVRPLAMGFALVWHIWWLVIASFAATIAYAIFHTFNYKRDFDIPAATVAAVEDARTRNLAAGA